MIKSKLCDPVATATGPPAAAGLHTNQSGQSAGKDAHLFTAACNDMGPANLGTSS